MGSKQTSNTYRKGVKTYLGKYRTFGVLLLFCIILEIINPNFFTWGNWQNLLRQITVNGILALGMTVVILSGGIDLSVGSLVAVSGVVAAKYMDTSGSSSVLIPVILGILVCAILGLFYGGIIAWSNLPPFVVTLSIMLIARGLALAYADGQPIMIKNEGFRVLGQGKMFGEVPTPVIIFLIVFILLWFLMSQTKFGRYVYAIGGNENAARASGINIKLIRTFVYVISGACAGLAGLILAARTQSGQPAVGTSYECDAIAAVVIGGTSMSGGIGGVKGTIIGVLMIGVINNGLNLLGVTSYYQTVAKGLIILAAVLLDVFTKRNKK